MFVVRLGKDLTRVRQEVSERFRRKCRGLRDVFCSRSWVSYIATWQSECKCLSEPPAATCRSFPVFITQSASNFHAGQCPCHTAKRVKHFLEAENTEIMKWPGQSPDWKISGKPLVTVIL